MKKISNSSLWVEKYRPLDLEDMILPQRIYNFFKTIIETNNIPNMILSSSAGRGKTSIANAICAELNTDKLFINASLDNSIDNIRYKVQGFATSSSFTSGQKVVIMDEAERITTQGQESLKSFLEQVSNNCRFIFTCNNYAKIIDPLKSRCQTIDFNFTQEDMKELVVKIYQRCSFILKNENIPFEKEILAEFIKKQYPDIRKTINNLQKFATIHKSINSDIFKFSDNEGALKDLISSIKNRKFNDMRKFASAVEPSSFYTEFYNQLNEHIKDESKPDIILILAEYGFKHSNCVDQEINLVGALVSIMKEAKWR